MDVLLGFVRQRYSKTGGKYRRLRRDTLYIEYLLDLYGRRYQLRIAPLRSVRQIASHIAENDNYCV